MIKIKDFAYICGCSLYTLRYYDEIEILKPIYIDKTTGYRFYSEQQVEEYKRIKEFQEIGFSIKEVKETRSMNNEQIVHMILNKIEDHKELLEKANRLKDKYIKNDEKTY